MQYWILSSVSLWVGCKLFGSDFFGVFEVFGFSKTRKSLQKVTFVLRELEETLLGGLVPSEERWALLSQLDHPWRDLAVESVQELRASGGSLLPTLRRLRELAQDQIESLQEARAKTSQAFAQVVVCSLMVPLLGIALYLLLPGIEKNIHQWLIVCTFGLMLSLLGALWLFQITERARWGGLSYLNRSWVLSSQCAGERFLARVRGGVPPDLAWMGSYKVLEKDSEELAYAWGSSVWSSVRLEFRGRTEQLIIEAGSAIKKSIQVSLMEGSPCLDKVETALKSLKTDFNSQVNRELMLLGTRSLKPLFICIAPSLLGILFFGLWLAAMEDLG